MSSSKRWNLFTGNGGCGCGMKPSDVFQPKPKSKTSLFSDQNPTHSSSSSTSSSDWQQLIIDDDGSCTSTTFSLDIDKSPENHRHRHSEWPKRVNLSPRIQDSLAVVKDSDDPYRDFRQSMLQMIFEKEIYSPSGLQQLLHCFLELNSPRHHKVIVQAFVDVIWNGGGAAVADGSDEETRPERKR